MCIYMKIRWLSPSPHFFVFVFVFINCFCPRFSFSFFFFFSFYHFSVFVSTVFHPFQSVSNTRGVSWELWGPGPPKKERKKEKEEVKKGKEKKERKREQERKIEKSQHDERAPCSFKRKLGIQGKKFRGAKLTIKTSMNIVKLILFLVSN